jgi:hypothetical protein
MSTAEKRWTLEAARELVGDVRARTERAVREADALVAERDALPADSPKQAVLEQKVQDVVGRWAREMEALGLEVKGVWLVDFDNGSGYYCWRWPETELAHYHGYEEGFDGRVRIQ